MRAPWIWKYVRALLLGLAALTVLIGYFCPQIYDSVHDAERITVYEGLPHQNYEQETFTAEVKTKPTLLFSGFRFYTAPLVLNAPDLKELRRIMGDRSTYQAHRGEKECGGFHPDYAVEWLVEKKIYRALICFGCLEVRFYGPDGTPVSYDLRRQGNRRSLKPSLLDLLKTYRKNRPPHERFGLRAMTGCSGGVRHFEDLGAWPATSSTSHCSGPGRLRRFLVTPTPNSAAGFAGPSC